MAGTAKTSRFMIGSGTLMLGPQASLWDLLPSTHSVGLVKNLQVTADPQFVDLTQGSKNTVVYSMMTSNPLKISGELYEYSAQNLTYGLSLDGSSVAAQTQTTTTTAAIAGNVTPTTTVPVASVSGLTALDMILIQEPSSDDNFLVRKISSIASLNLTVDSTIKQAFTSGATVRKVNTVALGSTDDSAYLSAKIAGKLADGTPLVMLFPKVRVTKGFTLAFNSEQYGNLPYEIEVMDLLPADTFYSDFTNKKGGIYVP